MLQVERYSKWNEKKVCQSAFLLETIGLGNPLNFPIPPPPPLGKAIVPI